MLHTFDNFQSCEFLTLFFFQCIGNILCQCFKFWNCDILQGIGTLLGLFDVIGKADRRIFDHGKLYGQLFYPFKGCLGLIQGHSGAVVSVGRCIFVFIIFYQRDLGTHNASCFDADGIFNGHSVGNLFHKGDTHFHVCHLQGEVTVLHSREVEKFLDHLRETFSLVYDNADALFHGLGTAAAGYLNEIRRRSPGLAPATAATITDDMILDERSKELFGEGQRFFDMMRMGRTIEFNDDFQDIPVSHRGKTIDRTFEKIVLPISQDEINANPALENQQNPGY